MLAKLEESYFSVYKLMSEDCRGVLPELEWIRKREAGLVLESPSEQENSLSHVGLDSEVHFGLCSMKRVYLAFMDVTACMPKVCALLHPPPGGVLGH